MNKEFENLKIKDLRRLTEKYKEEHPDVKIPQELLDELEEERQE